ncbi:Ig-like domain-containing protein, partial [Candidatus Peregrinibacteria bacterium]|nr:Ig-like domain-containing protein [Candidatus Peregrinibacteria bacterium]
MIQPAFASSNSRIEAYGIDTVAGSSTILKTKSTIPNQSIIFLVEKPNGGELFLDAQTDDSGMAKMNLLDYHTRKSGLYTVSAKLADEDDFGPTSAFRVYADEVSESQSIISTDTNTVTANGVETANLTVSLSDRYDNPLANHTVELISSRETDSILNISKNAFTDSDGKIRFVVASEEPGVSIYSAFDTTAGKSLGSRVKIAYFTTNDKKTPNFFGGDSRYVLAQAATTTESGKAQSLNIENISDIVAPGSTLSFTVAAYDGNKSLASSYRGTLRFSSSDSNATLPQDYTFTASDLGKHTFSLGLKFLTEGVQTLEVVDTSSVSLKATAKITVTAEIQNPGDDKTLVVLLPTEGTYSQSKIDVEGEGPAGWVIQIYDNVNKVGETIADSNGKFYFTLKNLDSGQHDIYAAISSAQNGTLETSKTVAITVDDSAPNIDEVKIVPEGNQKPGETFEIRVYTESSLKSVAAVLDAQLVELSEDISQKGLYVGELFAPQKVGEYPLDIILTDELGN